MDNTAVRLSTPLRDVALIPPPALPRPSPRSTEPSAAEKEAVERVLAVLREAAADVRGRQQDQLAELQRGAVTLAVAIASHLVHERIHLDDFAVEAIVQKAVARLKPRRAVTISLHPEDLRLLERRVDDPTSLVPPGSPLQLQSDPSLKRGDCVAVCGDVTVSWLLDDQLEEMARHLLGCLASHESVAVELA